MHNNKCIFLENEYCTRTHDNSCIDFLEECNEYKLLKNKLNEFKKEFSKNKIKKQNNNIYLSINVDRYNFLKTL